MLGREGREARAGAAVGVAAVALPYEGGQRGAKAKLYAGPVLVLALRPVRLQGKPLFSLNKGPTGVFKSVLDTTRTDGKRRDEIFVDVVERITWCGSYSRVSYGSRDSYSRTSCSRDSYGRRGTDSHVLTRS
jgi:hypothetical protein